MMAPVPNLQNILLLLILTLALCATKTYYDILGLKRDASISDIKKAYRTLSLKHHPDRNKGNEEEATIKFREINEAYEVLVDEDSRRDYDRTLRHGAGAGGARYFGQERGGRRKRPRDPFAQFNDVFQNDPFFADAFKGMDDLFSKTFQEGGFRASSEGNSDSGDGGGGWGAWLADKLGANINIQVSKTDSSGRRSTNSYSRQSGGRQRSSTYTSRSTSTIIENGRRIMVQSLEKDGNRIEEKYDGNRLVERKINGQRVNLIDDF